MFQQKPCSAQVYDNYRRTHTAASSPNLSTRHSERRFKPMLHAAQRMRNFVKWLISTRRGEHSYTAKATSFQLLQLSTFYFYFHLEFRGSLFFVGSCRRWIMAGNSHRLYRTWITSQSKAFLMCISLSFTADKRQNAISASQLTQKEAIPSSMQ